ncbi:MAG TPA: RecQ family ATP-dependent DNA helicase [Actinomadura sp.]|jgi:ATP-dependent DNA helicase RecQ|nr:RecQ family ATP-dependent DNA helicase [Actinomadura sp.]
MAREEDIRRIAKDVFGFAELRPGQREALSALVGGRGCLVVMPSGAGKSAIYQIAAVALGGPAVVVSPLLSLQRDQAVRLREHGLAAINVNSSVGAGSRAKAYDLLRGGGLGFVFLAPEQLPRDDVRAVLAEAPPALLAVDEAHCISEWGHDFRPDYLRLGGVIEALRPGPVVVALTATAAPPVREEIVARLRMRDPEHVIRGFDRPEIHLSVPAFHDADRKEAAVLDTVGRLTAPGIVYAATRRETKAYADRLGVRPYHAGMRKADRDETHRAFMRGETIVATSAFGMGVHQPGVRFVVHASVPGSLDEYYQEIGRAGRDGRPAAAVCCYRPEDLGLRRFFAGGLPDETLLERVAAAVDRPIPRRELAGRLDISERRLTALLDLLASAGAVRLRRRVEPVPDAPPPAEAAARAREIAEHHRSVERSRVEMMRRYAELTDCRRRFLLRYFGEVADEPCGRCDNCDAGRSTPADPDRSMFAPGARVEHRVWDKGTVLADEGERLIVFFDKVGYKELLTETVLTERLLAPAADPAGSDAGPPPRADGDPG